jgi:capsular polysaccharide biosynthesis protein
VDESDQTVTLARTRGEPPARPWPDSRQADADDPDIGPVADAAAGLASMSFITSSIRRRFRFCLAAAAIGLLIGLGLNLKEPPPYKATTSVWLVLGPGEDANSAIQSESALAQSRTVAAQTISSLQLGENVSSLLSQYTVAQVGSTNNVLQITASARSSQAAVQIAASLADQYLSYRSAELTRSQELVFSSLDGLIRQDKATIALLDSHIRALRTQPPSSERQSQLQVLQSQRAQVASTLASQQQNNPSAKEQLQVATTNAAKGSYVLDKAAAVARSAKRTLVLYGGGGLIAGLALGLGYVLIQALVTDRLRRRDDISFALGAPVRLSLRRARVRQLPGRRALTGSGRQGRDVQRIAAHLRRMMPRGSTGAPAALAVVPVESTQVAALSLAVLAESYARQGQRVIMADLSGGAHAARLFGVRLPGVRTVSVGDARLVVAIPDRDDVLAVGPLSRGASQAQSWSASEPLAAAYASADVLLSLVPLDPALGGEHLATWAHDTVVMVTAGRASSTRIHAAGEMIRLAGSSVTSAILLGADKSDESLGRGHPAARPVPSAQQAEERPAAQHLADSFRAGQRRAGAGRRA